MFLKISQNSQENTCQSLFLNKVRPATLLKNRPWHRCFPLNFAKFLIFSYRTPLMAASEAAFNRGFSNLLICISTGSSVFRMKWNLPELSCNWLSENHLKSFLESPLMVSSYIQISYKRCYHPHSWKIQHLCLSGGFFTKIHDSQGSRERGKGVYLTSLYNFHLPDKRLGISRVITAGSSHLHIASSRTRTGTPLVSKRKSLTTKLRVYFGSTASFITGNKSLKRMLDKLDPTTEP